MQLFRIDIDHFDRNFALHLRQRIGQPDAPVHTIGGIGDKTTVGDLHGMVVAAVDQRRLTPR